MAVAPAMTVIKDDPADAVEPAVAAPPAPPSGAAVGVVAVPPRRLYPVVVAAGAASLATEIAASRLLAPFFGSSTVVWANVIGLILVYLSVGYWVGGRLADRHASARRLGAIIVASALCIAVLPFIAHPILHAALRGFDALSVGAVVGSFVATLALFSIPVTLLGMVSPFAIRLALCDVREAGTVSGRLYALSTMGSIGGTFLPAIVTIPLVGTQRTMLGSALLLALAAALLLGARWLGVAALIAALLFIPPGAVKSTAGLIEERESAYQYVQVSQDGDKRSLQTNEGVSSQSVWRANTVLTGGEWDMFLVAPPLVSHPVRRVLIIGSAAGTTARAYSVFYPQAQIDGIELDPVVTDLAHRYFGLDDIASLHSINDDGRVFLERTGQRYDLILVDAYRFDYIPFYLATQEFFQLCRDHLVSGGAVAINVARVPGDDRLGNAIAGTVATVFPEAWTWKALRFNELVIALDRPLGRSGILEREAAQLAPELQVLRPSLETNLAPAAPANDPLTDDRAPVEWLADRMYLEQIASGRGLDEQLLPTRP
jgi:predicted membrane-bound spermidine synthase